MSKFKKSIQELLNGRKDKNFKFNDLVLILEGLNFTKRKSAGGSHRVYTHPKVTSDIVNLQPDEKTKGMAKPYQVKQVREIIEKYKLNESNGE